MDQGANRWLGLPLWSTQLSRWRFVGLIFACATQAATIAISWPLWQPRESPPHLPLIEPLSSWPFGVLLIGSLLATLLTPRWGWLLHIALLGLAILGDQFRIQPQFIGLAILIWSAASPFGWAFARWYLIALWFWAGVHKFVSPDWWADYPWSLLSQAGIDPHGKTMTFAVGIIAVELLLAILAVVKPRWAVPLCLLVHLGILVLFSPWLANRNYSVLPWNLAMATFGACMLWSASPGWPVQRWERWLAVCLLVYPVLYFTGWLDRGLGHVLYAGNVPRGIVARGGEVKEIEGWGKLAVPFPGQSRLLRQYFSLTAEPGDRLLIGTPYGQPRERYYLLNATRQVEELQRTSEAFSRNFGLGNYPDDPEAIQELLVLKVKLLRRSPEEMVFAAEIVPENFEERVLVLLQRLPNLEQLQLAGCPIVDRDLAYLIQLKALRGIGLSGTKLSPAAIARIKSLPQMEVVEE
jgi:hypothetical protein